MIIISDIVKKLLVKAFLLCGKKKLVQIKAAV